MNSKGGIPEYMKNCILKFGKWIAVCLVVITFGLLAIPGFFKLGARSLSGYQMIFRYVKDGSSNWLANNGNFSVCVIGIIGLVFAFLGIVCFVLDKVSSSLDLFGGILVLIASVIFFAMQGWAVICYKNKVFDECGIYFINYIVAVLYLLSGAMMTYKGYVLLKEERANPKAAMSYLKKNSK